MMDTITPVSYHPTHQMTTEQSVVQLICSMYQNPRNVQDVSERLTQFQASSHAWPISVALLLYCAPVAPSEESLHVIRVTPGFSSFSTAHATSIVPVGSKEIVAFFSAQTLATLCQAGFESLCELVAKPGDTKEETFRRLRSVLTELICCYSSTGSSPIVRQLTHSITACAIFTLSCAVDPEMSHHAFNGTQLTFAPEVMTPALSPDSETEGSTQLRHRQRICEASSLAHALISELLERYGRSTELFPALLGILTALPQECDSKRIAITGHQRVMVLYLLLTQTMHVCNAVATIFDSFSSSSILTLRPKDCHRLTSVSEEGDILLQSPLRQQRSKILRPLILQCFQAWLEAHSHYHRLSDRFQNGIEFPALPNELILLRETSTLPILLISLEDGIKRSLSTCSMSTIPVARNFQPNDHLTVDFDAEACPNWQVISAASAAVVETLDFFYSNSLHADGAGSDSLQTDGLPLINSTNIDSLLAVFNSLSRICGWMRNVTRTKCSSRPSATGVADTMAAIDVSLIPNAVLRAVANIMTKFVEVFLPALIFCIQYDGLELSESDSQPMTLPDEAEKARVLEEAEKLYDMMLEMLSHPSLEFRHNVLEFWFSLVGNQFTQQQAQLETTNIELMGFKTKSGIVDEGLRSDPTRSIIVPTFDFLVSTLMQLSTYPSIVAERPMDFPFEAWVKYRDEVGMSLTDMTSILGCHTILERAGLNLLQIIENSGEKPATPETETLRSDAPWQTTEVCLFVLTAVAPRAPAGDDQYIPSILDSLPLLPYQEKGTVQAVILQCAVSRFILWTAGYIGTQKELFGKCFQLLNSFIPDLIQLAERMPGVPENSIATQPELHTFLTYSERVMVEALNAIVTAASPMLAKSLSVMESDVQFVIGRLAELATIEALCLESRSSLIVSAGSVLQCLPKEKMQKYHYRLGLALHTKAVDCLPDHSSASKSISVATLEQVKLFFVALEAVRRPVHPIALPPPSPNAVPLERSSEHRHPVLNVMEEFWPTFQRCLVEFHSNEILVEYVCHCVVRVFTHTQYHAIRYTLFHSFLECLAQSFMQSPSVFHLGALRSMLGVFGTHSEEPIQKSLNACLVQCTERVLNAMNMSGAQQFIGLSPDIVGMTLDCINTALNSAVETSGLLSMVSFQHCLNLSITLTPECHHPKVLMTMILLMMRFVSWLEPLNSESPSKAPGPKGRSNEKWMQSTKASSELANRLMVELDLLHKIIKSIVRALTEIFQGNTQWIGIIGSLLVELLSSTTWSQSTRLALKTALEETNRKIVPLSLVDEITTGLTKAMLDSPLNHRVVCGLLKRLADQSEANWQKSQFSFQAMS